MGKVNSFYCTLFYGSTTSMNVNFPSLTVFITALFTAFLFSSKVTTPAAPWKSFIATSASWIFTESAVPAASMALIKIRYASYPRAVTAAGSFPGYSAL